MPPHPLPSFQKEFVRVIFYTPFHNLSVSLRWIIRRNNVKIARINSFISTCFSVLFVSVEISDERGAELPGRIMNKKRPPMNE
jgi:hypothetical protein